MSDVELYEAALERYGIDYYLVGGHAFYAQQEIFDLLNLLRAVASPSDGVALAGVLRSAFFSLEDETLFWLAQHPEGLTGGLAAAQLPTQVDAEQCRRLAHAVETLNTLRNAKNRVRICELIELALSQTGYDATLLAEFLGERKLANLQKVIEQARHFERDGAFELDDFIAELSEFVARQPKEPLAATLSEDTDVVRLMTIHQSKGLEFPIVFVPDVGRGSDPRTDRVHFDAQLGPLVKSASDDENVVGGYELWRFLERQEDLAELYRLLYVATTRAADYLVLSYGGTRAGDVRGDWMELLARRFDLFSGAMVGELPADEPLPRVRVSIEEPPQFEKAKASRSKLDLEKLLAEVKRASEAGALSLPAVEPVPIDPAARRWFSFSRLTGALHREEQPVDEVTPTTSQAIDPLGLGTLVHAVLAEIDFGEPGSWQELVGLYAERQMAGADSQMAQVAQRLVASFLPSARAATLASAQYSLPEAEFLLAWPPEGDESPKKLISGYIDRLYQDRQGDWHVIDFKTNQVTIETLPSVAAKYELQMLVYAMAAEQSLGAAPKSLVLHFLRGGLEHAVEWNAEARDRARQLVTAAIAATAAPPASE